MEVMVTGHSFESILPKDHPCHVCFKLADWFQRRKHLNNFPIGPMLKLCRLTAAILYRDRDHWTHIGWLVSEDNFLNIFPIGSYVKYYVRWWRTSWMEVWVTGYNFESWPFKDHSCHVCFKLAYWFQREKIYIFPIGSYVKIMSADDGHLGCRSGSQDIILQVDHLRIIHAMFALNWLTGFWGEDF